MRRVRLFFLGVVVFFAALNGSRPASASKPLPPVPILEVSVEAGQLTVKAKNAPMKDLIRKVSDKGKIKTYGQLRASDQDRAVTLNLNQVALKEGVERILAGYSVAFIFAKPVALQANPPITEIWFFPIGGAGEGTESSVTVASFTDDTEPNVETKLQAIDSLSEQKGEAAIPILLGFLTDTHRDVRLLAIETLSDFGSAVPSERFALLTLGHPDSETRLAAMESGVPLPRHVIERHARQDVDEEIREIAKDILEDEDSKETKEAGKKAIEKEEDASDLSEKGKAVLSK